MGRVEGAGGAIGRAMAILLAKEGAQVMISDLDESKAKETADLITKEGGKAQFMQVDVTNEDQVKNWIDSVATTAGKIDILINNAAAFVFGTIEEVSSLDWDKVLSINVKGYAFCMKHVVPHMKRQGGSIVNIGSISSFIAQPAFTPYNTSKGAILQLTRCAAMDLGIHNIRVNALCPGTIETPATAAHAKKLGISREEFVQLTVKDHFIKRLGTVEDVANAALFFASDESSFISGASLLVDGGHTAH